MDCVSLYKALSDESRLRILNLLQQGPLCVCHVQEALQLPQSKISKQLAYMKKHGLLNSRRYNNWTVYEIVDSDSGLFRENLRSLAAEAFKRGQYQSDLERLSKMDTTVACVATADCC